MTRYPKLGAKQATGSDGAEFESTGGWTKQCLVDCLLNFYWLNVGICTQWDRLPICNAQWYWAPVRWAMGREAHAWKAMPCWFLFLFFDFEHHHLFGPLLLTPWVPIWRTEYVMFFSSQVPIWRTEYVKILRLHVNLSAHQKQFESAPENHSRFCGRLVTSFFGPETIWELIHIFCPSFVRHLGFMFCLVRVAKIASTNLWITLCFEKKNRTNVWIPYRRCISKCMEWFGK